MSTVGVRPGLDRVPRVLPPDGIGQGVREVTVAAERGPDRAGPTERAGDWGSGCASVSRVLICDDRVAVRGVVVDVVMALPGVRAVVAVGDGAAVVAAFAADPADLVLIGLHRGTGIGAAAVRLLIGECPAAPLLVYGSMAETAPLVAAVAGGARGVLLWNPERQPHPGVGVVPVGGQRPVAAGPGQRLTDRELRVLYGMSQGRSNGEIGRELLLSEDSVKSNARRLYHKLGAQDRAHAVAVGLRTGLLT